MKNNKMTLKKMRKIGWYDGFNGDKSQIETFNFKKNKIPYNEIGAYISEYKLGYKAGQFMTTDFQNVRLRNNMLMYGDRTLESNHNYKVFTKGKRRRK